MRKLVAIGLGAVVLSGVAVAVLRPDVAAPPVRPTSDAWQEIAWPYLRDQFPAGKAYTCSAEACGRALRVTFRAKIGFCNCATGVSDDEELERIGDLHLVAAASTAVHEGSEIVVGRMKGRSRPYRVAGQPSVYSIAFNDRCDVIVATAAPQDARVELDGIEPSALSFLNSETVTHWAERAIGF